jgi:hypothetical protein
MPQPLRVHFVAGSSGLWRIDRIRTIIGAGLPIADRLAVLEGRRPTLKSKGKWILRGVTSNTRYTKWPEVDVLVSKQAGLMRSEATCAALIPIRKTAEWWGFGSG